jgi:hypothetical protein
VKFSAGFGVTRIDTEVRDAVANAPQRTIRVERPDLPPSLGLRLKASTFSAGRQLSDHGT